MVVLWWFYGGANARSTLRCEKCEANVQLRLLSSQRNHQKGTTKKKLVSPCLARCEKCEANVQLRLLSSQRNHQKGTTKKEPPKKLVSPCLARCEKCEANVQLRVVLWWCYGGSMVAPMLEVPWISTIYLCLIALLS